MEEPALMSIAGGNAVRQQSKLKVQLSEEEFTAFSLHDDLPVHKCVCLKLGNAKSAHDVPSEPNSLGHILEPMYVDSAVPQQR